MTKREFMRKITPTTKKLGVVFNPRVWQIEPNIPKELQSPEIKPIQVNSVTATSFTKTNLHHLLDHLPFGLPYYRKWKEQQADYRKTDAYKEAKHNLGFFNLAIAAGLTHDEHGSYGFRQDIVVIDFVWKKRDLKKYHACGQYLGLVNQHSETRYTGKFSGYTSHSNNYFVVGTNENGVPFCHQVSNQIHPSLEEAINWIWENNKIEARQGDVAITSSEFRHVTGIKEKVKIIDSHWVKGEIYEKREQIHVRNGTIYHTKDQHPPIEIGNEWKKILIGRRSKRGLSSAD